MKKTSKLKSFAISLGFFLMAGLSVLPTDLAWAQCPPGDVNLTSQAEVDAFIAAYPNCTTISGSLLIGNFSTPSDIVDISGLDELTTVTGILYIYNNPNLPSLTGLDALTTVQDQFVIALNNHPSFSSLNGLGALQTVTGAFSIYQNAALASLAGLGQLSNLNGLYISDNQSMTSLSGMNTLTNVGTLYFSGTSSFTNLSGLENLTTIDLLYLYFDNSITNLSGLDGLTTLNKLALQWSAISDISALSSLNSTIYQLYIARCGNLTNLSGLENMVFNPNSDPYYFWIEGNANLSICNVQSVCDFLSNPANGADISGNASGCSTRTEIETSCTLPPLPPCTNLTLPISGATNVPTNTDLLWATSSGATGYRLSVGTTSGGTDILNNEDVGNVTTYDLVLNLPYESTIYITIIPYNGTGEAIGCMEESFMTASQCPPGDVNLTSQAEVDAFITAYPDCTHMPYSITINGSDITNLNGLSQLVLIDGYLYIQNNPLLPNLSGLNALTSIGGYLDIWRNTALTSLSGLDALTSVGGYLFILANHALNSISALNALSSLGEGLYVVNNDALTSLEGLNAISSVNGPLSISNNDALTSLEGLNAITSVSSYLGIQLNPILTSLEGLNALNSVGGFLGINFNPNLTSLSGLEALTSIGDNLSISGNDDLMNFSGLDALASIGGYLNIVNNVSLTSLEGIENIDPTTISSLYLENNTSLSHCAISNICAYLGIPSNPESIFGNTSGCSTRTEVEAECNDGCPNDPNKTEPGICGCGIPDVDADMDGYYVCDDCNDTDPNINPGTAPVKTSTTNHNPNSTTVYWSNISGSTNYMMRYKLATADAWTEITSLRAWRRIYDLTSCTDYEVQFKNYKNGAWNCWSESDYFTTSGCAKTFNPGGTKGEYDDWQVFPNPATNTLNIVLNENMLDKSVRLTLRDQLGRTVWNQNIQNLETTLVELNVRAYNLAAGVYMLSLQNDESTTALQVVVSK